MGMFDTVRCLYKIDGKDYKDVDFQTKSLDNYLNWFSIEEDGSLIRFEYEMIQDNPNFKSKKKGMDGFIEDRENWKRKNERWEPFYFHGEIYFYGSTVYEAHELDLNFIARYSEGKLLGIYPATDMGQRIYKDYNGIEFLALAEMHRYDSDFVKENSQRILDFKVRNKSNKLLNFFGIQKHTIIRGILYSVYQLYKVKLRYDVVEYSIKNPIVTHKEVKKVTKKKEKRNELDK